MESTATTRKQLANLNYNFNISSYPLNASIYLPAFGTYVNYLKSFGDLSVKTVDKRIMLSTPCYDFSEQFLANPSSKMIAKINKCATLKHAASVEIDQILGSGNKKYYKDLPAYIKEGHDSVYSSLSAKVVGDTAKKNYKDLEQHFSIRPDIINRWDQSNRPQMHTKDLIEVYCHTISEHLIPEFEMLCNEVLDLYDTAKRIDTAKKPGGETFEERTKNLILFDKVIEVLKNKELVVEKDAKLCWEGIRTNNVGSLAGLAKYLEHAGIMKRFSIMADARFQYGLKFNIEADTGEWNKIYTINDNTFINFNSHPQDIKFYDDFKFILDL